MGGGMDEEGGRGRVVEVLKSFQIMAAKHQGSCDERNGDGSI
jgi:hypothetical protein